MSKLIKLGAKQEYDYPKSIKDVDEMTGEEFERFIFKYLKQFNGYEGKLTEKNDYGVDIILWDKDDHTIRYGAQCKRFGPNTTLGENDLIKMIKGVPHYGISSSDTGKPFLILFTSAEKKQLTNRGLDFIENEEIQAYYREDIIDMIRDIDEKLNRTVKSSNYSNIAFDASKKKNESFKENTKFVEMLKSERKKISSYNKITPLYMVFNDKTMNDIILKKPTTLEELQKVYGFNKEKVDVFGFYLINKIRQFLDMEELSNSFEVNKEEFTTFLKETRKKIASYNKIDKLYNVFNNKTLDEIVEKVPTTKDQLLEVTGIGPVKIDLWGEYLLNEIIKFTNNK